MSEHTWSADGWRCGVCGCLATDPLAAPMRCLGHDEQPTAPEPQEIDWLAITRTSSAS